MASLRVVEHFDVVEHPPSKFCSGLPTVPVKELALRESFPRPRLPKRHRLFPSNPSNRPGGAVARGLIYAVAATMGVIALVASRADFGSA